MTPLEIYRGSDGDATTQLYRRLEAAGPHGLVALNLFRACKCSERAKQYRRVRGRPSYRQLAYDRKRWSMDNLAKVLTEHGAELQMTWGWGQDARTLFGDQPSWVLYIETPFGQCSFHSPDRGLGPDFPGEWDGQRGVTAHRVIQFATHVLELEYSEV